MYAIREITKTSDPAFWPAMELYVESFPRDEREPVSTFVSMLERVGCPQPLFGKRSHLLVAENDEGDVIGMRLSESAPAVHLGFLVYVAVDPAHRNSGIGRRLIETAIKLCELDMLSCGVELDAVCFEAERIELYESEEDKANRIARLSYFEKLGAELITNSYVQPALTDDREPVPLYLLAHRVRPGADRRRIASDFCETFLSIEQGSDLMNVALEGIASTPTLRELLGNNHD